MFRLHWSSQLYFLINLLVWMNVFMDGYAVLGNIGQTSNEIPNHSTQAKGRNIGGNFFNGNNFGNQKPIGNGHGHNSNTGPFFCGPLTGSHYMMGSQHFCGGLNVNDCSALCFFQNFTYFQCEGNICHCFQ